MTRILWVVIFSTVALKTTAQDKWTLRQCIDYARKYAVSVKQADVQARLAKINAQQSRQNRYPTLGGSINSGYQHGLTENPTTGTLENQSFITGNANVQSNYNIFNWGARKNNIAANDLYLKADLMGVEKAQNDVGLAVANAFLQVMLRREQARISEVQMNQSKSQLENMRKLVRAGSQPQLNAIQIEAQVAKDSSNLLSANSLAEQAMITLKAYMNYDLAQPLEIVTPPVKDIPVDNLADLQPETVYNIAVSTQPTQRMYKLRIDAAGMDVKAARASMYPTLAAFAGLSTSAINTKVPIYGITAPESTGAFVDVGGNKYEVLAPSYQQVGAKGVGLFRQAKNNFGQQVGLALNFSIFNNHTYRSQWERARVNVLQLQLQNDQENLNLKSNIYNAYQEAFAALQKYNATKRTVEYSQQAFDISKKRFDVGLLGTLDFILTQNNLYLAQIDEISSLYDYVFKMKVLEFYKGNGIRL